MSKAVDMLVAQARCLRPEQQIQLILRLLMHETMSKEASLANLLEAMAARLRQLQESGPIYDDSNEMLNAEWARLMQSTDEGDIETVVAQRFS